VKVSEFPLQSQALFQQEVGKREMLALKHTFALATFSDQIEDFRHEIVSTPFAFPEV